MSWFNPDEFRKFIIQSVENLKINLKKSYPSNQVDSFINQKYTLLEEVFKAYILKTIYQDNKYSRFFDVLINLKFEEVLIYIFYIFTSAFITEEKQDIDIEYGSLTDPIQYQYERMVYPFLQLTDDIIKKYTFFHIVDFMKVYSSEDDNLTVFGYVYNQGLNELLRFYILYLVKLYTQSLNINENIVNYEELTNIFREVKIKTFNNKTFYEELENFYEKVIDDYTNEEDESQKRFFNDDDYESFNIILLEFFSEEKQFKPEVSNFIKSKVITNINDFNELLTRYRKNNNVGGVDVSNVNQNYILEFIDEPTSFVSFIYMNLTFNGKVKKVIMLGERHDKPGKETDYIKTEFQKICEWNNLHKTDIRVDFLGESDITYYGSIENVNLSSFMNCTDDQNLRKSLSSKYLRKQLPLNPKDGNYRGCDINKCFNDIFYNNVDYRLISSNYYMRFADYETFDKDINLKFKTVDYKFASKLQNQITEAIRKMENERIRYKYVGDNYYVLFGKRYDKFDIKVLERYVNETIFIKSKQGITDILLNPNKINQTIEALKLDKTLYNYENIADYIYNMPLQSLYNYLTNDICNFYNYVFKVYFPYVYHDDIDNKNNRYNIILREYLKYYIDIYGYLPERYTLPPIKNFYTNEANIYEYKYCKSLLESIAYIDENIIQNYMTAVLSNDVKNNSFLYTCLFLYDPYLSNLRYFYLLPLSVVTFSYMDIILIHNMLLPYDIEDKMIKNHPFDNTNILVYCGAFHSYTIMLYLQNNNKTIKLNQVFILNSMQSYSNVKYDSQNLRYIPCFSNFFLK